MARRGIPTRQVRSDRSSRSGAAGWVRLVAFRLLVAAGVLFGQFGAQLHALEHIDHDLAVAKYGSKKAPPLKHATEQCSLYAALDSGITGHTLPAICPPPGIAFAAAAPAGIDVSFTAVFRSRAPPAALS